MGLAPLLPFACVAAASPAHTLIGNALIGPDRPSFATPRLNTADLAVVGTGNPGLHFFRDATAANAQVMEQDDELLIATFNDWFAEVGTPLIFANIAGMRRST